MGGDSGGRQRRGTATATTAAAAATTAAATPTAAATGRCLREGGGGGGEIGLGRELATGQFCHGGDGRSEHDWFDYFFLPSQLVYLWYVDSTYIQYLVLGRSRIFRRCGCRSSKYLSFLPPPPQLLGTLPGSRTPNSPVSANTTTFHLDTAIRHLEQCIIVGFLSVPIGTNHHGKRMHDGHRAAKKIICHIRPNIQCVDPR